MLRIAFSTLAARKSGTFGALAPARPEETQASRLIR